MKNIILFMILVVSIFAQDLKHILLLNSYHQGMTWVDDITKSVNDVLQPAKNSYVVHIENMDTKRVYDDEYLDLLLKTYKKKYKNIKIDLILATDNNAFDFISKYRDTLFENVPVVFSGVNDYSKSMIEGKRFFTGVAEVISPKQTVELILSLHSDVKEIFIINDYLKTGRAWERSIKSELKDLNNSVKIIYSDNLTLNELQRKIASFTQGTIVLMGVYFADKNKHYITYEKIGNMLSTSSIVPVYALLDFNINIGVVGGKVISGYHQGEMMSKIALEILNGKNADEIEVVLKGTNRYIFDYNEIIKHNIDLSKLPMNSIIKNKPFSFYEKYKTIVLSTIVFILTLFIVLIFLVLNIKRREKAEIALLENEKKFHTVVNQSIQVIVILDLKGRILDLNQNAIELIEISKEELLNLVFWDISLWNHSVTLQQTIKNMFNDAILGKATTLNEVLLISKKGNTKYFDFSIQPVFDENEKLFLIIVEGKDMTEIINAKQKIEDNFYFQQNLIDSINVPIYYKDQSGKYLGCNISFEDSINKSRDELIGKDVFEIFEPDMANQYNELDKELYLSNKHTQEYDTVIKYSDKKDHNISVYKRVFSDKNGKKYIVGAYFDITKLKKVEKDLQYLNEELEQIVAERTKELEDSNCELETTISNLKSAQKQLVQSEKMASLGSLVAGVAHEINTPVGLSLTGVTHFEDIVNKINKLYLEQNLSEDEFKEFIYTSKELAKSININLQRTAQLVRSFKQVAVDQSSEANRVFNIVDYTKEILFSLSSYTKRLDLKIQVFGDEKIKIDSYPGAYSQIISNLVINSVVHGYKDSKDGNIVIDIKKVDNNIEIIYTDDGKGIKSEYLHKIFDPFFTTNRECGGSGLGLNVLYNLITSKLSGNVVCESVEKEGVKFKIIFPI